MVSSSTPAARSGVYYFSQGWKLIGMPGIRRFVILPLLVNIILMGGAFWWLFSKLESWIPVLNEPCPRMAAVAKLPAMAGGGYLYFVGIRLLLFDYSQLDCRAV